MNAISPIRPHLFTRLTNFITRPWGKPEPKSAEKQAYIESKARTKQNADSSTRRTRRDPDFPQLTDSEREGVFLDKATRSVFVPPPELVRPLDPRTIDEFGMLPINLRPEMLSILKRLPLTQEWQTFEAEGGTHHIQLRQSIGKGEIDIRVTTHSETEVLPETTQFTLNLQKPDKVNIFSVRLQREKGAEFKNVVRELTEEEIAAALRKTNSFERERLHGLYSLDPAKQGAVQWKIATERVHTAFYTLLKQAVESGRYPELAGANATGVIPAKALEASVLTRLTGLRLAPDVWTRVNERGTGRGVQIFAQPNPRSGGIHLKITFADGQCFTLPVNPQNTIINPSLVRKLQGRDGNGKETFRELQGTLESKQHVIEQVIGAINRFVSHLPASQKKGTAVIDPITTRGLGSIRLNQDVLTGLKDLRAGTSWTPISIGNKGFPVKIRRDPAYDAPHLVEIAFVIKGQTVIAKINLEGDGNPHAIRTSKDRKQFSAIASEQAGTFADNIVKMLNNHITL